jgi:hypothetical protein
MNMNEGKRMTYTNANGMNGLSSLYGNAIDTMTKSKNHWNHRFLISRRLGWGVVIGGSTIFVVANGVDTDCPRGVIGSFAV